LEKIMKRNREREREQDREWMMGDEENLYIAGSTVY
jgi:hypothetical protein